MRCHRTARRAAAIGGHALGSDARMPTRAQGRHHRRRPRAGPPSVCRRRWTLASDRSPSDGELSTSPRDRRARCGQLRGSPGSESPPRRSASSAHHEPPATSDVIRLRHQPSVRPRSRSPTAAPAGAARGGRDEPEAPPVDGRTCECKWPPVIAIPYRSRARIGGVNHATTATDRAPADRRAGAAGARGAGRRAALRAGRHGGGRAPRPEPLAALAVGGAVMRSPPGSAPCSPTARPAARPAGSAPASGRPRSRRASRRPGWRSPAGLLIVLGSRWSPAPLDRGPSPAAGRGGRRRRRLAAIAALGAPGLLLATAGNGWMRGVQDTRRPLRYVLGANVLSAVLCPLLVYPLGLGLVGSAVANVIAQTALRRAVRRGRWSASGCRCAPDPGVIRQQLMLGRDLLVRGAAFQACFLSATAVAARFGAAARRRAPDRAAAVVLHRAGARRGGDRGPVAGRRRARRPATSPGARAARPPDRLLGGVCGVAFAVLVAAGAGRRAGAVQRRPAGARSRRWSPGRGSWPCSRSAGVVFALDGVFIGAGDVRYLRNLTLVGALGGFLPAIWLAYGLRPRPGRRVGRADPVHRDPAGRAAAAAARRRAGRWPARSADRSTGPDGAARGGRARARRGRRRCPGRPRDRSGDIVTRTAPSTEPSRSRAQSTFPDGSAELTQCPARSARRPAGKPSTWSRRHQWPAGARRSTSNGYAQTNSAMTSSTGRRLHGGPVTDPALGADADSRSDGDAVARGVPQERCRAKSPGAVRERPGRARRNGSGSPETRVSTRPDQALRTAPARPHRAAVNGPVPRPQASPASPAGA